MKYLIEILSDEVGAAFGRAGFDPSLGKVAMSNRPDLCEFQCNGAMAAAKALKKNPLEIAEAAAGELQGSKIFSSAQALKPGFLNLKLSESFVADYVNDMSRSEKYGLKKPEKAEQIIVDYGGPNVAKPLHIGHLRAAIIGESVKRLCLYMGHRAIGDIHMGDWGLQMGNKTVTLNLHKTV